MNLRVYLQILLFYIIDKILLIKYIITIVTIEKINVR